MAVQPVRYRGARAFKKKTKHLTGGKDETTKRISNLCSIGTHDAL